MSLATTEKSFTDKVREAWWILVPVAAIAGSAGVVGALLATAGGEGESSTPPQSPAAEADPAPQPPQETEGPRLTFHPDGTANFVEGFTITTFSCPNEGPHLMASSSEGGANLTENSALCVDGRVTPEDFPPAPR